MKIDSSWVIWWTDKTSINSSNFRSKNPNKGKSQGSKTKLFLRCTYHLCLEVLPNKPTWQYFRNDFFRNQAGKVGAMAIQRPPLQFTFLSFQAPNSMLWCIIIQWYESRPDFGTICAFLRACFIQSAWDLYKQFLPTIRSSYVISHYFNHMNLVLCIVVLFMSVWMFPIYSPSSKKNKFKIKATACPTCPCHISIHFHCSSPLGEPKTKWFQGNEGQCWQRYWMIPLMLSRSQILLPIWSQETVPIIRVLVKKQDIWDELGKFGLATEKKPRVASGFILGANAAKVETAKLQRLINQTRNIQNNILTALMSLIDGRICIYKYNI